jgi:hypothetical protein
VKSGKQLAGWLLTEPPTGTIHSLQTAEHRNRKTETPHQRPENRCKKIAKQDKLSVQKTPSKPMLSAIAARDLLRHHLHKWQRLNAGRTCAVWNKNHF